MFLAFPLLAVPVLFYNLALMTMSGGLQSADASAQLACPLFIFHTASGGLWTVTLGDLFLAGSLVVLFLELLKATDSRNVAVLNHSLSMILFVVCLVEFLLLRGFATSVFFLISLMVLLDVLAGFIVTVVASRRDIALR